MEKNASDLEGGGSTKRETILQFSGTTVLDIRWEPPWRRRGDMGGRALEGAVKRECGRADGRDSTLRANVKGGKGNHANQSATKNV